LYADDAKVYRQIFNSQAKEYLQHDLMKLNSWADNCLIKLNISKCKKVSFARYTENIEHYSINKVELENVDSIKDLGVLFDSHLKFAPHLSEKINKAYRPSILGIIRRNITFLN